LSIWKSPWKGLLVEDAAGALGDHAHVAADAREHVLAQLVVGERLVADEGDLADDGLGGLADDDDDVDLAGLVLDGLEAVGHLGEEEALLDVGLLDLLDVGLDGAEVEDAVELEVEDLVDVVELDLAVALDDDLADRGALLDDVGRGRRRSSALDLDADVLELAHRPQAADVGGEVAAETVAPLPRSRARASSPRSRRGGCPRHGSRLIELALELGGHLGEVGASGT
jgi:hypothetical protein